MESVKESSNIESQTRKKYLEVLQDLENMDAIQKLNEQLQETVNSQSKTIKALEAIIEQMQQKPPINIAGEVQ